MQLVASLNCHATANGSIFLCMTSPTVTPGPLNNRYTNITTSRPSSTSREKESTQKQDISPKLIKLQVGKILRGCQEPYMSGIWAGWFDGSPFSQGHTVLATSCNGAASLVKINHGQHHIKYQSILAQNQKAFVRQPKIKEK